MSAEAERILDVLDVGLQTSAETGYGTDHDPERCARCQRHDPMPDGDLCPGCRTFLLGDSDDDPTVVRQTEQEQWIGDGRWRVRIAPDDDRRFEVRDWHTGRPRRTLGHAEWRTAMASTFTARHEVTEADDGSYRWVVTVTRESDDPLSTRDEWAAWGWSHTRHGAVEAATHEQPRYLAACAAAYEQAVRRVQGNLAANIRYDRYAATHTLLARAAAVDPDP